MERGLLWLPLLVAFFWLTWQGNREYRKVEAYRVWAPGFDRAKYDIYAVLGQKGDQVTWGKPTVEGPVELETFCLMDVQQIRLLIDGKPAEIENPPQKGRSIELAFSLSAPEKTILVPFTEIPLAAQWAKYLDNALKTAKESI